LSLDDRSDWSTTAAYRDLRLLLRVGGLTLSDRTYTAVRLASASLVAALCLAGRKRPVRQRLTSGLNLGLCWLLLCGPATEGATYQLLGPPLLWALFDAWRRPRPVARAAVTVSGAIYLVAIGGNIFPFAAEVQALGLLPLSAAILFGVLVGLDLRDLLRPAAVPAAEPPLVPAV
jgi:hypothetical protein